MLRQNKVSAYYERATRVDKINVNDLVLLYHNNNRIIAVGAVVNDSEGHDFKDLDIEHWVDVNWLWKDNFDKSKNPINPIIRNDIGITMVNNTVVNITDQVDYKKLFEEITKRQNFL